MKKVSKVDGLEPWSCDHFQCENCDSTYADEKSYNRERAKAFRKAWNLKPVPKHKTSQYMRKMRYGITHEEFTKMIESCNNKCAICNKDMGEKPNCDHCHVSGKLRGLLCTYCNTFVGYLEKTPHLIDNAIKYIEDNR